MSDETGEFPRVSKKEWKTYSNEEKAEYFSKIGDYFTLQRMIMDDDLEDLSEFDLRKLLSDTYNKAAEAVEFVASKGMFLKEAYEHQGLAEAYDTAPRLNRARALEILLNPEGKELKEQLKEMFPYFYTEKQDPKEK